MAKTDAEHRFSPILIDLLAVLVTTCLIGKVRRVDPWLLAGWKYIPLHPFTIVQLILSHLLLITMSPDSQE